MSQTVKPIPEGYAAGIPYLTITGADRAIDFYKQVFGAVEKKRYIGPNGKIFHAELKIGQAPLMLTEENLEWGAKSPTTIGDSGSSTVLFFEDVDAVAAKVTAAGIKFDMPVENMFWGDRSGCFTDPFGHKWMISTHVEDVSEEEMAARANAHFGGS